MNPWPKIYAYILIYPIILLVLHRYILLEHCKESFAFHLLDPGFSLYKCFSCSGNQQGSPLINDLQEQETILRQCTEQLESVELARSSLIALLKEALKEQVLIVLNEQYL